MLTAYTRLYAFLSQIMPFQDVELEKLYTYGRYLLTKLPKGDYSERLKLDKEVALEYYRLQKMGEGDLVLQEQGTVYINPSTEAGLSRPKEDKDRLSNIIAVLNEKNRTDFTPADRLFFEQMEEDMYEDQDIQQSMRVNTPENFRFAFEEAFINTLINRMDSNQEIFERIMEDPDFKDDVMNSIIRNLYYRFNKMGGGDSLGV